MILCVPWLSQSFERRWTMPFTGLDSSLYVKKKLTFEYDQISNKILQHCKLCTLYNVVCGCHCGNCLMYCWWYPIMPTNIHTCCNCRVAYMAVAKWPQAGLYDLKPHTEFNYIALGVYEYYGYYFPGDNCPGGVGQGRAQVIIIINIPGYNVQEVVATFAGLCGVQLLYWLLIRC